MSLRFHKYLISGTNQGCPKGPFGELRPAAVVFSADYPADGPGGQELVIAQRAAVRADEEQIDISIRSRLVVADDL